MRARRGEEHQNPYHVDRYETATFLWIIALLVLTLLDGFLTLLLLEGDFEETNPAMRWLIRYGPTSFIVGKYALTAWGLPLLLVFQNYSVFHPRLRVGSVIPAMVGLYLVLVLYQIGLLWLVHPDHSNAMPSASADGGPATVAPVTLEKPRAASKESR